MPNQLRRAMLAAPLACFACGRRPTETDTGGQPPEGSEVRLEEYPQLRTVGGSAVIDRPDELLHVLIACVAEGEWIAVWSICTHGACAVAWEADSETAVCPCHGSVFDRDGTVVDGPAPRALTAFVVEPRGDSLWLRRP